jgi:hypothetical protein
MIQLLLLLAILVHSSHGESLPKKESFGLPFIDGSFEGTCPKATFEFKNKTKSASYNFVDSSIGNIGSLETCPCKCPRTLRDAFEVPLIDTGRPYVYLPCYPNSSWGNDPYFSNCIKPMETKHLSKSTVPKENLYQKLSVEEVIRVRLSLCSSGSFKPFLSYR